MQQRSDRIVVTFRSAAVLRVLRVPNPSQDTVRRPLTNRHRLSGKIAVILRGAPTASTSTAELQQIDMPIAPPPSSARYVSFVDKVRRVQEVPRPCIASPCVGGLYVSCGAFTHGRLRSVGRPKRLQPPLARLALHIDGCIEWPAALRVSNTAAATPFRRGPPVVQWQLGSSGLSVGPTRPMRRCDHCEGHRALQWTAMAGRRDWRGGAERRAVLGAAASVQARRRGHRAHGSEQQTNKWCITAAALSLSVSPC